jgi:hypothetical protein
LRCRQCWSARERRKKIA